MQKVASNQRPQHLALGGLAQRFGIGILGRNGAVAGLGNGGEPLRWFRSSRASQTMRARCAAADTSTRTMPGALRNASSILERARGAERPLQRHVRNPKSEPWLDRRKLLRALQPQRVCQTVATPGGSSRRTCTSSACTLFFFRNKEDANLFAQRLTEQIKS